MPQKNMLHWSRSSSNPCSCCWLFACRLGTDHHGRPKETAARPRLCRLPQRVHSRRHRQRRRQGGSRHRQCVPFSSSQPADSPVPVQCIGEAFGVDPSDDAQRKQLSIKPAKLQTIFDVFLKTRDKVGSPSTSTTSAAPSTSAPPKPPSAEDKKKAEKHKQTGNTQMSAKKHDSAIDSYSRAIALDPTNAVYFSNRAAAYSSKGDHPSAVEDAKKAIEADPSFVKAYSRLGYLLCSVASDVNRSPTFSVMRITVWATTRPQQPRLARASNSIRQTRISNQVSRTQKTVCLPRTTTMALPRSCPRISFARHLRPRSPLLRMQRQTCLVWRICSAEGEACPTWQA